MKNKIPKWEDWPKDQKGHPYIESPFGWGLGNQKTRVTFVPGKEERVRIVKINEKGVPLRGPELDLDNIPYLIESLIKVYNTAKR